MIPDPLIHKYGTIDLLPSGAIMDFSDANINSVANNCLEKIRSHTPEGGSSPHKRGCLWPGAYLRSDIVFCLLARTLSS